MTEDLNGYKALRPERARPDEAGLIMEEFRADVAAHGPQGLRPEPMPLLGPAAGTVEWADWAETREWRMVHDAIVTMIEILGDWLPEGFDRLKERDKIVRARVIAAERMRSGWRTIITPQAIHQHRQEERLKRLDAVLEGEHDGLSFDRKALETLLMYVDCGLSRPEEAVFYRTPEMRIDELLQANNRLVETLREAQARIGEMEHDSSRLQMIQSGMELSGVLDDRGVEESLSSLLEEVDEAREVLSPAVPAGEKRHLGELAQAMASKAANAVNMLGAVDVAAEPLLTALDFVGMYVADVEPVNGVNVGMLRALRDALNFAPPADCVRAPAVDIGRMVARGDIGTAPALRSFHAGDQVKHRETGRTGYIPAVSPSVSSDDTVIVSYADSHGLNVVKAEDLDLVLPVPSIVTAGPNAGISVGRAEPPDFQHRVQPWMMACFGPEISADRLERGDRLLEEVIELLQSGGYPRDRIAALTDYVFDRPQGEINQEVGGVMVTLAAYCLAFGVDMHKAGEAELARIWTKVEAIRAKQAAKPTGSALPIAVSHPVPVSTTAPLGVADGINALADALEYFWNPAIDAARTSQDGTAIATAGALAEGFAAMARRLREREKETVQKEDGR